LSTTVPILGFPELVGFRDEDDLVLVGVAFQIVELGLLFLGLLFLLRGRAREFFEVVVHLDGDLTEFSLLVGLRLFNGVWVDLLDLIFLLAVLMDLLNVIQAFLA